MIMTRPSQRNRTIIVTLEFNERLDQLPEARIVQLFAGTGETRGLRTLRFGDVLVEGTIV
jgi:hypothetical protein